MDIHNIGNLDNKRVEKHVKKEQKQEFKQIGRLRKRPGQTLFAMGEDFIVYKVEIQENKAISFETKDRKSRLRAIINPNHPLLYSLNKKNAIRKFRKRFLFTNNLAIYDFRNS